MFRSLVVCLALALLQVVCVEQLTADIVVTSASRGVGAAATHGAPDFDSTSATGSYFKDAMSSGSGLAGFIMSGAHQSSTTPFFAGPMLGGIGAADVFAAATGATGFSNTALSFFDVEFDVTHTGFYRFDASVDWVGADPPPYGGFAMVELRDLSGAFVIDGVLSTPASPGVHSLHGFYLLTAGVHYQLVAEASIGGGFASPGEYSSHGEWSFTLTPEPGSLTILTFALGLCLARYRRSNQI